MDFVEYPSQGVMDLGALCEVPGYRMILKSVLKSQIQLLVQQLSEFGEEECCILTACLMDGSIGHLGSNNGKNFLNTRKDLNSQFFAHCIKSQYAKNKSLVDTSKDKESPKSSHKSNSLKRSHDKHKVHVSPYSRPASSSTLKQQTNSQTGFSNNIDRSMYIDNQNESMCNSYSDVDVRINALYCENQELEEQDHKIVSYTDCSLNKEARGKDNEKLASHVKLENNDSEEHDVSYDGTHVAEFDNTVGAIAKLRNSSLIKAGVTRFCSSTDNMYTDSETDKQSSTLNTGQALQSDNFNIKTEIQDESLNTSPGDQSIDFVGDQSTDIDETGSQTVLIREAPADTDLCASYLKGDISNSWDVDKQTDEQTENDSLNFIDLTEGASYEKGDHSDSTTDIMIGVASHLKGDHYDSTTDIMIGVASHLKGDHYDSTTDLMIGVATHIKGDNFNSINDGYDIVLDNKGKKTFICKSCGKVFRKRFDVTRHQSTHTGMRFFCTRCPKSFTQKAGLKSHERVHIYEERMKNSASQFK